jgi:hypothetical protein
LVEAVLINSEKWLTAKLRQEGELSISYLPNVHRALSQLFIPQVTECDLHNRIRNVPNIL